ncbi:hypothetical protein L9F63_007617, partial [Diploptera punctata]
NRVLINKKRKKGAEFHLIVINERKVIIVTMAFGENSKILYKDNSDALILALILASEKRNTTEVLKIITGVFVYI